MSEPVQRDWRSERDAEAVAAIKVAEAAKTTADGVATTVQKSAPVWRANVEIRYATVLALNLAPREAVFDVPAALVGDRIQIFKTAKPTLAGVSLLGGVMVERHTEVFDIGKVPVSHIVPAVGVGQVLSIPLLLVAYRDV